MIGSCHYLSPSVVNTISLSHWLPCLAVPRHALPRPAAPRLAQPGLARPRRATPCLALPGPAAPRLFRLSHHWCPCLASPDHAQPGPAMPRRARPCLASPRPSKPNIVCLQERSDITDLTGFRSADASCVPRAIAARSSFMCFRAIASEHAAWFVSCDRSTPSVSRMPRVICRLARR